MVVVDLNQECGTIFRVIPAELWSVENNLSTSTFHFQHGFSDFADSGDSDGVFRGFR
jgi:hypothetical protein